MVEVVMTILDEIYRVPTWDTCKQFINLKAW